MVSTIFTVPETVIVCNFLIRLFVSFLSKFKFPRDILRSFEANLKAPIIMDIISNLQSLYINCKFLNNGGYFTSAGQDISITEQVFCFFCYKWVSGLLYGNFVLVFIGTFHNIRNPLFFRWIRFHFGILPQHSHFSLCVLSRLLSLLDHVITVGSTDLTS